MTQPLDRHSGTSIATRWTIGLVEPLFTTSYRAELDNEMIAEVRSEPIWANAWFGGVISDMTATLPDDDPWRQLAGTIERGDNDPLLIGIEPPPHTGASLRGKPFGSYTDAEDMSMAVFDEPVVDVAVAALADDLDPAAAAILAFSFAGWEQGIAAVTAVHEHLPEDTRPDQLFKIASQALRWALHRRRSYGVTDDPWPVESGWTWEIRARKIAAGQPWAAAELELALARERIEAQTINPAT